MEYLIVFAVGLAAGAFLDHHFTGKIDNILGRVETAVKTLKS